MKERDVVNAPYFKFDAIGDTVAGRITKYDTNNFGDYIMLTPLFIMNSDGKTFTKYPAGAIGLTTDLSRKIAAEDKGRAIMIRYDDTKSSGKASPQKLFKVFELDPVDDKGVFDALAASQVAPEGASFTDDTYPRRVASDSDLPF